MSDINQANKETDIDIKESQTDHIENSTENSPDIGNKINHDVSKISEKNADETVKDLSDTAKGNGLIFSDSSNPNLEKEKDPSSEKRHVSEDQQQVSDDDWSSKSDMHTKHDSDWLTPHNEHETIQSHDSSHVAHDELFSWNEANTGAKNADSLLLTSSHSNVPYDEFERIMNGMTSAAKTNPMSPHSSQSTNDGEMAEGARGKHEDAQKTSDDMVLHEKSTDDLDDEEISQLKYGQRASFIDETHPQTERGQVIHSQQEEITQSETEATPSDQMDEDSEDEEDNDEKDEDIYNDPEEEEYDDFLDSLLENGGGKMARPSACHSVHLMTHTHCPVSNVAGQLTKKFKFNSLH